MSPWTCHCAGWDTLDKPGKTPDELLLYRWQGAVPTTLLPCHRARRNLSFGCRVELAAALLLGSAMGLCRVQHHPESYSESNRILKHILGLSISKQALETAVEEDAADVKAFYEFGLSQVRTKNVPSQSMGDADQLGHVCQSRCHRQRESPPGYSQSETYHTISVRF